MKTLLRVAAISGAALTLLLAAPALAQAGDAKSGLTCDVAGAVYGSVVYHGEITLADFCHGADGAQIKAVSINSITTGATAVKTQDLLGITIDVEYMDLGVEYIVEATVTDGTNEAAFVWSSLVSLRGTPDIDFTADKDNKATGDLSRNDYRDDFVYTIDTSTKHGDITVNPDGTFLYQGDKDFGADQFYYKVAWKTKYHGVEYEIRSANLHQAAKPEPSPSKSTTKPAAGGKDQLAQTGAPVPLVGLTGAGALALGGGALWLARRRRAA
ncbi:hypothetical protein Afil01_55530 [Actinorhabdospora filicis]|uniref:LPXTG cell wall anchor domain-containing protein n=1 Tax=Actinorhabdospora filicis TaxID=1785913 RepID=A0A9W6SR25_9ACTN|nr:Ig-like domain-containing protein [Actinorhabdospora filicis]GLZ80746.1 hypothetical protein Afil01_55530 [Actinorhabdospora filicis]